VFVFVTLRNLYWMMWQRSYLIMALCIMSLTGLLWWNI
jgi:hypothetical protein